MALSGIISSITTTVTSVVQWFFQVMPVPLRIFFFIFFIVFVITGVMGFALGFWYTCDSLGTAYGVSEMKLDSQADAVQWGFEHCIDPAQNNVTQGFSWFASFNAIAGLARGAYDWFVDAEQRCSAFRSQLDSGIVTRDEMLQAFAEPVPVDQGISVGCARSDEASAYSPTLSWYGVNVLDKRVWLLCSLLMLLMPLAYKWYEVFH